MEAQTNDEIVESRRLYAEGLAAKEKGDFATYRARVEAALALRPNHMDLIYKRAGAAVLAGDTKTALLDLYHLTMIGLVYPADEDPDFRALSGKYEFPAIVERFKLNGKHRGGSTEAFKAGPADFAPEGIVFDPTTQSFFLSGVRTGAILRRDSMGVVTEFVPGQAGLWSALGMALDNERRELWVGRAAIRETAGVDTLDIGRTGLFRYDLTTGQLKKRYDLGSEDGAHLLGDITLGPDGSVYASDAETGIVWRWNRATDQLEILVDRNVLASPQGLTFGADPGKLYVADYSRGPMVIDLNSNEVSRVEVKENALFPGAIGKSFPPAMLGIDGLMSSGTSLIAIQNATNPRRVVRLWFSADGDSIDRVETLDSGHPEALEPTHGVVVDGEFYFVANSLWSLFQDGKLPMVKDLPVPLVLKVSLNATETSR